MVKEHNLNVWVSWIFKFCTVCEISGFREWWVYVNQLPVSFVAEHQSFFAVSVSPEIWWVVQVAALRLEAEVWKVTCARHQYFVLHENRSEVFRLHPVSQIDVTADLTFVLVVSDAPDKQNRCESSVSKQTFTLCELHQEPVSLYRAVLVREGLVVLWVLLVLFVLVSLFLLFELLSSQWFSLAMMAKLDQLAGKLLVF